MSAKTDSTKPSEKQTMPAVQIEKTIADLVLNKVKIFTANRDIRLPDDYSAENALKSAWLILLDTKDKNGNQALSVCTKDSIANAMLNMVLQGLNPVKKQCDFLVYGDKLTLQREYHGTIALAKRYAAVKEAVGTVIYEGDTFEYEILPNGYKRIKKHEQALENIDDNKIKGAYATLIFQDTNMEPYIEVMTIQQIRQSWQQGATKGASPAHKNFPGEMAKKTVISRACKLFISSSDDSSLFDDDDRDERSQAAKQVINDNANREEITMDVEAKVVEDKKPEPKKPEPAKQQEMETADVEQPEQPAGRNDKLPGF
jgi:recombination protein RecT